MFKIPFLVDLAVNLLKGITNIVGNYGVAIIILTIMRRTPRPMFSLHGSWGSGS